MTEACKKHGGFYLGSIGGPAAILAQNCIRKVEVLEYPELGMHMCKPHLMLCMRFVNVVKLWGCVAHVVGMEAIWKVEVEDFPAFIVVDNKGNDFFKEWQTD